MSTGTIMSNDKTTHFGYRQVDESAKADLVSGVFNSVASRYDLMNDLMSGGVHRVGTVSYTNLTLPTSDLA